MPLLAGTCYSPLMTLESTADALLRAHGPVRAGVPYIETFVGKHDVIVTCQLPEQDTVPRMTVSARNVMFSDLGLQVRLPVDVLIEDVRATCVNGTVDVHLRRQHAR